MAQALVAQGLDHNFISTITGLSVKEIENLWGYLHAFKQIFRS
jgi:hypothetical protein